MTSTATADEQSAPRTPRLFRPEQVARLLGKSEAWLERARLDGSGPAYTKIGRSVRYRDDDLLAWLEENRRTRTADG